MEFLKLLEGIRNPVLDAFFSLVTHLGEETLFIVAGLIFFWCISKKQGYFVLFVGLFGTVVNQFLKLVFRIPRPWVQDESFTIVESARAEATGYSFPSGHTQTAVGVFGSAAVCRKEKWLRAVSVAICVLVPFSRMYLGVHTPLDVGVSFALALVMVFAFYPIISKCIDTPSRMRVLFSAMCVLSLAFVLFAEFYPLPSEVDNRTFEYYPYWEDADFKHYESGIKNGYKMLGCFMGLWLTYELDRKYIKFDTSAPAVAQILKVVLGLIPLLLIKSGLKAPLNAICGGAYFADGIRYFIITAFAGAVWPLTFGFFAKIGKNKEKQ